MDEIDRWAKVHKVTRSEAIRELIKAGLKRGVSASER
jgi:hypothetical protein